MLRMCSFFLEYPLLRNVSFKNTSSLQVSTLSDITSGDGYYLLDHIFDKDNPLQQYSSIRWPNQGCPSDGEWTKWRYAIRQCFPTNRQGRLLEPLGKWYKIDPKWGSFFDSRTSKLHVKAERWMQFQPNTQDFSGNNPQYIFSDYHAPPEDCTHIAVAWFDTTGNLQTRGIRKLRLVEQEIDQHWTQEWQSKSNKTQRRTIARAIRNRQAYALTDGSYKEKGSAGYSITDFQQTAIRGACRVPGT